MPRDDATGTGYRRLLNDYADSGTQISQDRRWHARQDDIVDPIDRFGLMQMLNVIVFVVLVAATLAEKKHTLWKAANSGSHMFAENTHYKCASMYNMLFLLWELRSVMPGVAIWRWSVTTPGSSGNE
ncbi:uncharacterized protein BCR38DRAFT_407591 [Pseudomassariella vexata]|uniref:Uncharacterized protein n=1 Tax=Pseudomassariella vexata TaxID=1141098 RepID=A0A1Y2E8M8_9PEZI|nr:uncharacterized protein BCR38DRAFT_407591 [Pseudomassariella vexata]ORY67636.1 hypothetical protein BCR38DRAFT_407591 [Pseudomassariella vexata]